MGRYHRPPGGYVQWDDDNVFIQILLLPFYVILFVGCITLAWALLAH